MTFSSDALIERMQLQNRASRWRIVAIIAIAALLFLLVELKMPGNFLPQTDHIARIKIEGMILQDIDRDKALLEVSKNDNVKAIIAHIDSPGGTSIGGEALYQTLSKAANNKPLVVVMDGMATSAAYMAALPAEHIVAHNATITGSIGVIFEMPNLQNLANKIGVELNTVASGDMKGEPSIMRPLTNKSRQVLESVITDFYDYFVKIVAENRELNESEVRKLADGRIYSAQQALELKLVDEIGNEETAKKWLSEHHNLSENINIKNHRLSNPNAQFEELFGQASRVFSQFFETNHSGLLSVTKNVL